MGISRRPVEWLELALRNVLMPVPRHLGSSDEDRRLYVQLASRLRESPPGVELR